MNRKSFLEKLLTFWRNDVRVWLLNATGLEQDILLITERLMGWTDDAIRDDLSAYDDVSSNCACVTRDLLLKWIRDLSSEEDT